MRRGAALLIMATLMALAGGCQNEPEHKPLLRIDDQVFQPSDFEDYLKVRHIARNVREDPVLLKSFLEEYLEHRVLVFGAIEAGIEPPKGALAKMEREDAMINKLISREYKPWDETRENELRAELEKRFKEPRARIKTIRFDNARDARRIYNQLRRNRSQFDSYLEQFSPDLIDSGVGQGVFSRDNMPEAIAEQVFSAEEPKLLEPFDFGEHVLLVEVLEFLPPESLEEAEAELRLYIRMEEKEKIRKDLVQRILGSHDVEYNPELVLGTQLNNPGEKG